MESKLNYPISSVLGSAGTGVQDYLITQCGDLFNAGITLCTGADTPQNRPEPTAAATELPGIEFPSSTCTALQLQLLKSFNGILTWTDAAV